MLGIPPPVRQVVLLPTAHYTGEMFRREPLPPRRTATAGSRPSWRAVSFGGVAATLVTRLSQLAGDAPWAFLASGSTLDVTRRA